MPAAMRQSIATRSPPTCRTRSATTVVVATTRTWPFAPRPDGVSEREPQPMETSNASRNGAVFDDPKLILRSLKKREYRGGTPPRNSSADAPAR